MAGKFGKFGLKLSLYPSLSLSVLQKRPLTMKAGIKISVDVAVKINHCSLKKSTSKTQVFKKLKIFDQFHSKILKTSRLNNSILFLYLF